MAGYNNPNFDAPIKPNNSSTMGKRNMLDLLHSSFSHSQVRCFPHQYGLRGNCVTQSQDLSAYNRGISGLAFDKEGKHLAYVTRAGCIKIYKFDSLYHSLKIGINEEQEEQEKKLLWHHNHNSDPSPFVAVKWNPCKEQEVACVSSGKHEIVCYDLGHGRLPGPRPGSKRWSGVEVFTTKNRFLWSPTDVAFTSDAPDKMLACDRYGCINVWDTRTRDNPILSINRTSSGYNSIDLAADNKTVYAAGNDAVLRAWDIREAGKPVTTRDLKELLRAFPSWKPSNFQRKAVHSISFNPSCHYQLAFHLEQGWSGIFDVERDKVTHLHFPPMPALLKGIDFTMNGRCCDVRKPAWLSRSSIYMTASPSMRGIHLMDFYPSTNSPCHVDFSPSTERAGVRNASKFIPSRSGRQFIPISCACHPLYDILVVGSTMNELEVISGVGGRFQE